MRKFLTLILSISFSVSSFSQTITASTDIDTLCPPTCANLSAVTTGGGSTTGYTNSLIGYAPDPYAGTPVFLSDDSQTGLLPIGFDFCFYGNMYNQFVICSNNWIGFQTGETSTWVTNTVPSTLANRPKNCIMGPWQDINPGVGGNIYYQTLGVAPFRRLVVTYENVPMFSCTAMIFAAQIIIYEGTNIIENHISSKPICTTWNSGNAVQSLHNVPGTVANTIAGRNNTNWSVTNEARQWTPNGPPTIEWYEGATFIGAGPTVNVCPTVTTTYTVNMVTCGGGIIATDNVTVYVECCNPPIMSFTAVSCNGGSDGTATALGDGVPGYTYLWDDPGAQTTSTATGLTAGTYTCTVTDANGCVESNTITVTEPPAVTGNITAQTNVSCNGGTDGSVTVAGGGGTPGYQYSIDGGTTFFASGTFTGLGAGAYTVIVEDANGCQLSVAVTITEPTALGGAITAQTNVSCNGGADGSVTVAGSAATPGYTYSIDGGATFFASGTFTGLTAGSYTVIVEDANGCQFSVPVTITEPTGLSGSITAQTDANCNGALDGSVTVAGSAGTPGYTYSIDGGTTFFASGTFTGLGAGAYTVIVEDANGCQFSVPVTINEPPALSGSITTQVNVSCNGGTDGSCTVDGASGTPGYQYSIDGGTTFFASGTFTGLGAGAYTVIVEDANGCQFNVAVNITEPSAIGGAITVQNNVSCNGATDGDVTVLGSGATPGYTYSIDGGTTFFASGTFTGLAAGAYSVIVEDANGCQTTVPVTITEPTPLVGALNSVTDATCGASNGAFDVSASGATGPYQYSIDGGTTFFPTGVFTGLAAGAYIVTIEDANGCQTTVNVTVADLSGLVGTLISTTDVSCNGGNDGACEVSGGGSTAPYTFSIDGGTTFFPSGIFTGLTAGAYSVIVEDGNGCQVTVALNINEPTAVVGTLDAQTPTTCNLGTDGTATFSGSGGTPGYQYSIDGGTTFFASGAFTGLAAGLYTVIVEDANGCQGTVNVTITEPTDVTLTVTTVVDALCNGSSDGSVTVTAGGGVGGYQYSDDGGGTWVASGTFTGLAAGTYTFTTEDANGCQETVNATVNEPTAVTGNLNSTTGATCGAANGAMDVNGVGGTPGYTYSIDGGTTFFPSGVFTGLLAGTYNVIIEDANGCQGTLVVNVADLSGLIGTLTAQTDVSCNGGADGSVTVVGSGSTAPYTYSIDGGTTFVPGGTFTGLSVGPNDVIVQDGNGCTVIVAVTILEPTALTASITATTDVSCNGGTDGTLTGLGADATPGYTYSIDGATFFASGTFTGLTAGPYTVTVEDANGCQTTVGTTINEPTALVLTEISTTDANCNGSLDGALEVSGSGATPGYQYSIDGGGTWQPSGIFAGLAAGTYTLTVEDANLCQTTLNVTVNEPPAVTAAPGATIDATCSGFSDGSLTAVGGGGVGGYTYSIDGGTTFVGSPTFAGLASGTYTVIVEDANGCQATVNMTVNEPVSLAVIETIVDETCTGDCLGSIDLAAAGGTAPYTYSIDGGGTTAGTGLFASLCDGAYSIVVTDDNGCTYTNNVSVVDGAPYADATIDVIGPFCLDANPVALSAATPGGTFSGPGVVGGMFDPSAAGPGTHTITNTIATTCGDTQTLDIVVNDLPVVIINDNGNSGCVPFQTSFFNAGTAGTSCVWTFGDGTSATSCGTVSHSYDVAGAYDVGLTVTDANGCVNSDMIFDLVNVFDLPVAEFTFSPHPAPISEPLVEFDNHSTGGVTYDWTFENHGTSNAFNPTVTFNNVGDFDVTLLVTGNGGCTDQVSHTVTIQDEIIFFVPNIFTPDGDNYNETFKPIITAGVDVYDYHLTIFNRWGEVVFESFNEAFGWNGHYGSKGLVEDGTYVWQIEFGETMSDKKHKHRGHVTILK